jgi:two-component system, chemotaxis family, sensor kinase CheA
MIEDAELRDLFQTECTEHLQHLESGLLHLEQNPTDQAVLEEAFREAHSLKGSSRMLGVSDVEKIAHRFEDILGEAKRGDLILDSQVIDVLCGQLDAIGKLVHEAITGEDAEVDVDGVLAVLADPQKVSDALDLSNAPSGDVNVVEINETVESTPAPEISSVPEVPPAVAPDVDEQLPVTQMAAAPYHIETIRVPPQKLDDLIRSAGELLVTRLRVDRRLGDMDDLLTLVTHWQRENRMWGTQGHTDVAVDDLLAELEHRLEKLRGQFYDDSTRLGFVSQQLSDEIRAIRLLPFSSIFSLFSRTVRDLGRELGKEVTLTILGGDTVADKRILEEMKDPLMHMIRNAVDHGIELPNDREAQGKKGQGVVQLEAHQIGGHIEITLQDDGRGIDAEKIKQVALVRNLHTAEELANMSDEQAQMLIFAPSFSTNTMITDVSGRGVGMDVVRANVERLKGEIHLASTVGVGSCLTIRLPVSLATSRVVQVAVGKQVFGFPVEYISATQMFRQDDVFSFEGRSAVMHEGQPLALVSLRSALNISGDPDVSQDVLPCVIIRVGAERLGVMVSALLDEQEVVVKPLGTFLKRVPNIFGAAILETGVVCMVINAGDLVISARRENAHFTLVQDTPEARSQHRLLVAEDSITTRTQIRRILEGAGYFVETAVDGRDALGKLQDQSFHAVVSDIEMPNLDGFGLVEHIRAHAGWGNLPVILLTSLASEEHRQRGLDVGANAYIIKGTFNQKTLLEALERLI